MLGNEHSQLTTITILMRVKIFTLDRDHELLKSTNSQKFYSCFYSNIYAYKVVSVLNCINTQSNCPLLSSSYYKPVYTYMCNDHRRLLTILYEYIPKRPVTTYISTTYLLFKIDVLDIFQ